MKQCFNRTWKTTKEKCEIEKLYKSIDFFV